jgi:4-deoxy-L-threo-5-hexosulose-uronate ketol-isomerase
MLTVETRHAIDPATAKGLDTAGLRSHFHAGGIFADGEIRLVYTHYDRLILGGAVPGTGKLTLDQVKECGTASILDRREMGILNIGESGTVSAAGKTTRSTRATCSIWAWGPVR